MPDKIKVLFLASDPFREGAPLRLDEEVRAIRRAIDRGSARDTLELVPLFALRTRDLQEALMRYQPQVVHFASHGSEPGDIILGDEYGRPRPVGKEALGRLIGILNNAVKAVVMNGCDTLGTVEVLSEVVDYAIGMNRPVTDDSAIVFAEAFYVALSMGQPVGASFDLAVNQLQLEGNDESTTPVLRIRAGVDTAVPLITPRAVEAPLPPAAGEAGRKAGQMENVFGRFTTDEAEFDNTSGSGGTVKNTFGDTEGKRFTFRN